MTEDTAARRDDSIAVVKAEEAWLKTWETAHPNATPEQFAAACTQARTMFSTAEDNALLLVAYQSVLQPLHQHSAEVGEWSGRLVCWIDGEAWPCRLVRTARDLGLETRPDPPGFLGSPAQCAYENRWTDEVGTIPVCTTHGNNSRHEPSTDPHRPCLTVDPYPDADDPQTGSRDG